MHVNGFLDPILLISTDKWIVCKYVVAVYARFMVNASSAAAGVKSFMQPYATERAIHPCPALSQPLLATLHQMFSSDSRSLQHLCPIITPWWVYPSSVPALRCWPESRTRWYSSCGQPRYIQIRLLWFIQMLSTRLYTPSQSGKSQNRVRTAIFLDEFFPGPNVFRTSRMLCLRLELIPETALVS